MEDYVCFRGFGGENSAVLEGAADKIYRWVDGCEGSGGRRGAVEARDVRFPGWVGLQDAVEDIAAYVACLGGC